MRENATSSASRVRGPTARWEGKCGGVSRVASRGNQDHREKLASHQTAIAACRDSAPVQSTKAGQVFGGGGVSSQSERPHWGSQQGGVLVKRQMLKQGHMGFVLRHRLSAKRGQSAEYWPVASSSKCSWKWKRETLVSLSRHFQYRAGWQHCTGRRQAVELLSQPPELHVSKVRRTWPRIPPAVIPSLTRTLLPRAADSSAFLHRGRGRGLGGDPSAPRERFGTRLPVIIWMQRLNVHGGG